MVNTALGKKRERCRWQKKRTFLGVAVGMSRLGTSRRDYGHRKRAYKAELIIAETNKIE